MVTTIKMGGRKLMSGGKFNDEVVNEIKGSTPVKLPFDATNLQVTRAPEGFGLEKMVGASGSLVSVKVVPKEIEKPKVVAPMVKPTIVVKPAPPIKSTPIVKEPAKKEVKKKK